ncbi:Sterile alpha motif (SAM) domain-containing protein [Striga hermonthica]|uniref:Sterile alpha motif (SAM) domain-containing protein n=1 Tax=Striga hermonthica TaxID=68872 RepID=A0A9N7NTF9_STRHE|nr:Sterile alpha motif (SAM) domain-containing protein [Striga hermonthica]
MAAELHPSDTLISTVQPSTILPSSDPPQLDHAAAAPTAHSNPPKRQRRPSVRLGEIGGDSHYEHQNRRPNKNWSFHKNPSLAAKTSKTRPLTNLVNGIDSRFGDSNEPPENFADFSHRKTKNKKSARKARTNWNKPETAAAATSNGGGGGEGGINESVEAFEDYNEDTNEDLGEFEPEGTESPSLNEQQTPVNSAGLQFWDQPRRRNRSESNGMRQNEVSSQEKMNVGVREWLAGLGLGRYSPVFEIHEVDDEVLPLLTLDDLKDMGINAVGSRRKMYNSIIKLRRGFS